MSFHRRPLVALLDDASQRRGRSRRRLDIVLTTRVVRRVSRIPVFSLPVFPKACLRESLVLFYMLRRAGYPAQFVVGVRKNEDLLVAHSWVTLHGQALLPASDRRPFSTVYRHPVESNRQWFTSDAAAS